MARYNMKKFNLDVFYRCLLWFKIVEWYPLQRSDLDITKLKHEINPDKWWIQDREEKRKTKEVIWKKHWETQVLIVAKKSIRATKV